mmetsp:Transcript_9969/g.36445  ORF Transcript_9969/g.36445 Transcript_9969/m.36445 type:complete len:432 (-) Transcript_9969:82-1377(-)
MCLMPTLACLGLALVASTLVAGNPALSERTEDVAAHFVPNIPGKVGHHGSAMRRRLLGRRHSGEGQDFSGESLAILRENSAQTEVKTFIAEGGSFIDLNAGEAATLLKRCMREHGVDRRDNPGVDSGWAGKLIINQGAKVIAGPLIPKSGSTTLRAMFGDPDRPQGMIERAFGKNSQSLEQRELYTQFAVVRNPLLHFLDVYKQAGYLFDMVIGGARRSIRGLHAPNLYCQSTHEEKHQHFVEFLERMGITNATDTKPALRQVLGRFSGRTLGYNEHMPNQLHWLQDYYDFHHGNVTVLENIDFLVRLERFDEDIQIVREGASKTSNGQSNAWFEQSLAEKRSDKTYRMHVAVDDAHTRWIDLCADEQARLKLNGRGEDGIMTLLHHYSWLFYRWHALAICRYLLHDFACLRYPFPKACQMRAMDALDSRP